MLAAPLARKGVANGAVVAFRAGEGFARADAATAGALADAVSVELEVAGSLRHAEQQWRDLDQQVTQARADRLQALALYELARAAGAPNGARQALDRAAGVVADMLDADLAAIWLAEPDGRLRAAAARGYVGTPEPLRPDSDPVLVRVTLGQRVETAHFPSASGPIWMGGATDALIAPIVLRNTVRGVLIQARLGRGFSPAERELAPLAAEALAPLTDGPIASPGGEVHAPPLMPVPAPSAVRVASDPTARASQPAARSQLTAIEQPVAGPKSGRGAGRVFAVLALILAMAAAAAGFFVLGPLAYLGAAVLLLIALLTFH